jgi:transcriptional regulator with XRE-family HTH domain
MATVTQKFGLRVRDLRKKKGLTQEKLAELTKIDYSYLNAIEAGKKNPSLKRIAKLARILGVSIPELFSFK